MKNIPKKIYLQVDPDKEDPEDFKELNEVTFSEDKINDNDIKYYNADTVQELVNFFSGQHIDKKYIIEHISKINKHE